MALAPVDRYRSVVNGQETLIDGTSTTLMRERFCGQWKGFSELERMLDDLEKRLRDRLEKEDNTAK